MSFPPISAARNSKIFELQINKLFAANQGALIRGNMVAILFNKVQNYFPGTSSEKKNINRHLPENIPFDSAANCLFGALKS